MAAESSSSSSSSSNDTSLDTKDPMSLFDSNQRHDIKDMKTEHDPKTKEPLALHYQKRCHKTGRWIPTVRHLFKAPLKINTSNQKEQEQDQDQEQDQNQNVYEISTPEPLYEPDPDEYDDSE